MTDKAMDIWVGIDGSETSDNAFIWAARFPHDPSVTTIRPVMSWSFPTFSSVTATVLPPADSMHAATVAAAADVFSRVEPFAPDGVVIAEPIVMQGEPAQVLTDLAEPHDVIVVGSRGLGGFKGLLLGSVSSRLAAKTHCPLVIVPPDHSPLTPAAGRVVIGVEFTDESKAAVLWAAKTNPEAELELVHAWSIPALSGFEGGYFGTEDFEKAARDGLAYFANEIRDEMSNPRRLQSVVVRNDPRRALLEQAEDADLLVVGAQRHHGAGRVFLGSVAQNVVHHLKVPTVVVPSVATGE